MKLTLGFSPCPNDTFIFDALIHHKIDTEGLEFEVFYDDVETLNQKAMRQALDITKLSYHAFAYVTKNYALLDAGSALGFGVGPMLISNFEISISDLQSGKVSIPKSKNNEQKSEIENPKSKINNPTSEIRNPIIGIPGKYTTANFLLGLAFPNATNKVELVFSDIEDAVLDGRVDAGLIIHENRFTYQNKGLKKIIDLGDYWEQLTGCAIPLGGIVVNRALPLDIQHKINRVLRSSVEFAFANPKSGLEYIRSLAQEMSEEVMYKHIDLYVNKYSVDLGIEGKKAIKLLFDTALEKKIIPKITEEIFLNPMVAEPIK
jgi:1,4-dihydroxy-6-naphthoate synthase